MRQVWIALLAAGMLPAARAEFQLFVVDATGARAAPPQYSLGTVYAGDSAQLHFQLRNMAPASAVLNYLEVRGTGFGPKNPLELPIKMEALTAVGFTVTFSAPAYGSYAAIVDSEGTSVVVTVTVPMEAPPVPRLTVSLPSSQSGQQGSVTVSLDAPARREARGNLTLDFQPGPTGARDPTIVFSNGTRTTEFICAAGDAQCRFADQASASFQTGTTSGILTFAARLGTALAQKNVTVLPAPVSVATAQGMRVPAGLEIHLTGYDNARTAGLVSFTFFNAAGNPIAPGAIRVDAAAAFRQFYQTYDAGGTFLLRAVFPVSGDALQITGFEASIDNSAGAAVCARTMF